MRISLNLATRPYADLGPAIKRLRIGMGVLLLVAAALLLGLRAFHQKAEEARARERGLDAKIAAINKERQGYQDLMRRPPNALLLAQAGALNRLFDEKTFSWTLAMEDLETVLPSGVQATALEPLRAKDGKITLRLRVVGPRDRAVDLVENLEHSRHFLFPSIVGESAESTGGAQTGAEPVSASSRVNFELVAEYNPVVPQDEKAAAKQTKEQKEADKPADTNAPAKAKRNPGTPKPAPALHPPLNSSPPGTPQHRSPFVRPPQPKPNTGGPR